MRERSAFPNAEYVFCHFLHFVPNSKHGKLIPSEVKQSLEICLGDINAVKR